MFKKDEKEGFKSFLMDFVKNNVLGKVKEQLDDLMDNIRDAIIITQKKLIRSITAMLLLLIGLVFLLVGGTFFLTDVLGVSRSTVYLSVGVVLVMISIILSQSAKLLKYDFNK